MSVYRFKVTFEDYEDVSREIDIRSTQSFVDLHYAIQEAIGFDASQPASFYMSNDNWIKDREISLEQRPPHNGEENVLMKDAVLGKWIADPHQKIYYVFDYNTQWTFYIELHRIFAADDTRKKYPVCVKVNGEAPKQKIVPLPVKTDVDESAEDDEPNIVDDDYTADTVEVAEEVDEPEEVVINAEEADDITNEGEVPEEQEPDEDEQ